MSDGSPTPGADPQQVADLLRTFSSAPARRRRRARADAPDSIVPLIVPPEAPPLDPGRIEAARERLKAEAAARLAAAAAAAAGPADAAGPPADGVDPASFDAARARLRRRPQRR
ncbi:hypothetical protein NBH00_19315 [Paraconexibacter antarcticus]|uniref:Uncharacterized protein n=1 Tax=Paraconexibacter antarcticus TaxID=2949664 RepID=A0ABY5DN81_9ACTN|nr:hypothetical protein [Paraconexibacter antarcticus]UTI63485.1 hypothetical protein NBH00_19315 [Paraconexibacter antarcticus]